MSELLIDTKPRYTIIENVAINCAAEYFEACLSSGADCSKYKNHKDFARKQFQKFIPFAIDHLTTMLGNENLDKKLKDEIYFAIMERTNNLPEPKLSDLIDLKPLPPVIVNTKKFGT